MISAFLDTNVLLGITETDLLLSLSETGGMLRPYWSEYVFDEFFSPQTRYFNVGLGRIEFYVW